MSLRDTEPGRRTHHPDDGPPEGGSRKPCTDLTDVLPLLHDHELGPAESAELEMHLAVCSRCQAQADAYEQLSSVLKRWDAEEVQPPVPHLRMQHAVLARVAEHGAHRRKANRVLRLTRFATAASVLLALGGAIVAGLLGHRDAASRTTVTARMHQVDWPAERAVQALAPLPELEPLVDPAEASTHAVSGSDWMTARLPALPKPPAWVEQPPLRRADVLRLARLERMRARRNDFERRIRAPATVWFGIDGRGMHRIGSDALDYLRESGKLAQWQLEMQRRQNALETSSSPAPVVGRASERPRDVLAGLPGLAGESMEGLDSMQFAGRVPGLRVAGMREHLLRGSGLKTQVGGATWIEAQDPMAAQEAGQLRFAETHRFDRVVAFVKGTGKPIFIPDGQLLLRGAKDRVVAEPVWIPASAGESRVTIPCRVVQRGVRRKAALPPVLSDWVAGPTVRSLLRRKASDVELLDAIHAQLRIADPVRFEGTFTSWSLADLPQAVRFTTKTSFADRVVRVAPQIRKDMLARHLQGFVAEGRGGGREKYLYGVEITRVPGEAGAALLTRLFFSYALESAVMVQMQRHVSLGSFHRPAPRAAAYQALRLADRGMDEHKSVDLSHRTRALRQHLDVAKEHPMHVEVLDVDGTQALVSVTSEGARER